MKKTAKKAVAKKSVSKPQYTALAIVMGRKYTAKGTTVPDTLAKLDIKNCKGKCILSVSDGKTTRERVLMPAQSFRLFSLSKMMREIALKQVSHLFF